MLSVTYLKAVVRTIEEIKFDTEQLRDVFATPQKHPQWTRSTYIEVVLLISHTIPLSVAVREPSPTSQRSLRSS